MVNSNVISGLNDAKKTSNIFAYLINEQDKTLFTFLFNPEEKSFTRTAKYDEGYTALAPIQAQFYKFTTGRTLVLPNLLLESYVSGKTCQLLLDKLQNLMVADLINSKYSPSPVFFKWGSYSFGPAVITNLSWTETSWLDGMVATARVNLQLLEIPKSQLSGFKSNVPSSQQKLEEAVNKSAILTDRQKSDAIKQAKDWLAANIKKLSDNIVALIRTQTYKFNVTDNGLVSLLNKKNELLGPIGIYKDNKLDTSNNTFILKSSGM